MADQASFRGAGFYLGTLIAVFLMLGIGSYTTPTATVLYSQGVANFYGANMSGFTDGTTYTVGVRAFNAMEGDFPRKCDQIKVVRVEIRGPDHLEPGFLTVVRIQPRRNVSLFQLEIIIMSKFRRFLDKFRTRLRHFTSIIVFMIYIAIATAHFCKVDDPRVMGGLHVAAGVAHLL